jgi:glycosyltransferase involved in cell wall biosynthesis
VTAARPLHVLVEVISSDLRTGAANEPLLLADHAARLGLRFSLCGDVAGEMRAQAERRGVAIVGGRSRFLSMRGAPGYALDVLRWLLRLRRARPDVVHLNYAGWAPSLACAASLAGVPVVARAGGEYHEKNRANRWIAAYVANCAQHGASLAGTPLASRVRVVGSLFNMDRLRAARALVRPLPPRPPGRVRFAFLGQLVERKGIAVLVDAFARLAADADLLLVGGSWAEPGYPRAIREQVSRLGLEGRIHLEDHRPDAPAVLEAVDAFVLPSLSEARPQSIIEAMYLGLPVVATRTGGVPTLVEDGATGLLVPPGDAPALAAALDALARSPELRTRLGAAARRWAEAELSPERALTAHAELYRTVAE